MRSKPVLLMALVALAGVLVMGATTAQPQPGAPQKWEYRWVGVVRAAESGADWAGWFEVTAEGRRQLPAPVNLPRKLAEFGEEGWELVSVTPMSNHLGGATTQGYGTRDMAGYTSQLTFCFKRPKG